MSNKAAIVYFTSLGVITTVAVMMLEEQDRRIKNLESKLKTQKSISDLYFKSMKKCLKKVHPADRVFLQQEVNDEIAFFDIVQNL